MLIFALALVQFVPTPRPFTADEMRDVRCVAYIGIRAEQQRRGTSGYGPLPDVQADGRRWAGLVGTRIMDASGQPREAVAYAMTESAKALKERVFALNNPLPQIEQLTAECLPLMQAELAASPTDAPLPKPVKAQ